MEMGIDRRGGVCNTGFYVGQKSEQQALVVAFRKPLAIHDSTLFQNPVWVKKPVRSDEVYARMIGPSCKAGTQHAGKGALADCDAAGDADDVGDLLRGGSAHELLPGFIKMLNGGHVKIQEAREGNVDILHFAQRDLFADSPQGNQFLLSEQERRVRAQSAPLLTSEVSVPADGGGRGAVFGIGNLQLSPRLCLQLL